MTSETREAEAGERLEPRFPDQSRIYSEKHLKIKTDNQTKKATENVKVNYRDKVEYLSEFRTMMHIPSIKTIKNNYKSTLYKLTKSVTL